MERKTVLVITLALLIVIGVVISGCVNPLGSGKTIPKPPLKPPTDDWEKDWCIRYHCSDPAQKDSTNCKKIDCNKYL